MIKTVRNSNNNKVVGISVNGKRYSVSKELCHALSREEEAIKRKAIQLKEKAESLNSKIENKFYEGVSHEFDLKFKFNSDNTVNSEECVVTFNKEYSQEDRDFILMILVSFTEGLNQAQRKRTIELNRQLKSSYQSIEGDAA
jgi:hypothetical protein